MGTGPWPQPPTEAEQLQALMAAANGESCTSSSFLLHHLLLLLLHQFIFWPNLLAPHTAGGGGVRGHVVCLGLLLEGNKPDWLIDSPCVHIDFFLFSVWRLSRGRLPRSRSRPWARLAAALGINRGVECLFPVP